MKIMNAREYIERLLWIRTKEGQELPLKLKPAQVKLYNTVREQVRAGKPVRIIVLKARQMGFSTLIAAMIFHACATQRNRAAMMVAHQADATGNLYNMHKLFYDHLPLQLQPMKAASNAIEMRFENPAKDPVLRKLKPGLRSRIRCATAGGEGVGRSDTLQYLHASEYAFWPSAGIGKERSLLGMLQAVPSLPGTMVFIESTANGFDDFKKRWDDAVAGRSDFVPVFFGWNEEPDYRMPVEPGTVWTDEEKKLAEDYRLEPEQLVWRRWAIVNNCGGDVDLFKQEYPICPEEAFLATGGCWFDTAVLMNRIREIERGQEISSGEAGAASQSGGQGSGRPTGAGAASQSGGQESGRPTGAGAASQSGGQGSGRPTGAGVASQSGGLSQPALRRTEAGAVRRGRFVFTRVWDESLQAASITDVKFEEREKGPVTIWRAPEERVPYVLGGDTAGEGSDWFSAYVIDNTNAQMCARIWQQYDEAGFAEQVYCLGLHFNKALVGLEVNFSTFPTAKIQELGYPRLYVRQAEDSYLHEARKSFGWRTDSVTRPAMLSELRETVEAHPEIICDADLLREMLVFVKDKTGRPAAMTGEHDDLVMGYGITLKIRNQQSAVREQLPGRKGRYTKDMYEDYMAAGLELRRYLESVWGKP